MSESTLSSVIHITNGLGDRIDLSWVNGSGAPYDSIAIYRNGTLLYTINPANGATTYQDSTVSVGTAYSYYIRCFKGAMSGDSNTTASITPLSLQAPTIGTSTLSGTTVTTRCTNNGSTPDYFNVYRSTGGSYSVITTRAADHPAYDDAGNSAGQTVTYKWSAYISGYGESALSAASNAIKIPTYVTDDYSVTATGSAGYDDSGVVSITDTVFVYAGAASNYTELTAVTDSYSVTVTAQGIVVDAQSVHTAYAQYYGDSTGKVYLTSDTQYGDNGVPIVATWNGKVSDFGDMFTDCINKWKTVFMIKIKYMDLFAATPVNVYLWSDKDQTWTVQSQNIGTGDGTSKDVYFYFVKTGEFFQWRIECSSADKAFLLMDTSAYFGQGPGSFPV